MTDDWRTLYGELAEIERDVRDTWDVWRARFPDALESRWHYPCDSTHALYINVRARFDATDVARAAYCRGLLDRLVQCRYRLAYEARALATSVQGFDSHMYAGLVKARGFETALRALLQCPEPEEEAYYDAAQKQAAPGMSETMRANLIAIRSRLDPCWAVLNAHADVMFNERAPWVAVNRTGRVARAETEADLIAALREMDPDELGAYVTARLLRNADGRVTPAAGAG